MARTRSSVKGLGYQFLASAEAVDSGNVNHAFANPPPHLAEHDLGQI
jgi:hypothetical protein